MGVGCRSRFVLFCIVFISAILFSFGTAHADTYKSPDGTSRNWNLTVDPGTHTFIVDGITAFRWTEWYVSGVYKETDKSEFYNGYADPSYSVSFSSGSKEIKAIVYNDNWSVLEVHTWKCTVGQPDLTKSSNSLNKTSAYPGDRLDLSITVKNIGSASANSGYVYYYWQKGSRSYTSSYKVGSDSYGALSPTGTSNESFSYTIPSSASAGTYYFCYYIDATGTTNESNEGNNKYYYTVTVNEPPKPDLIIQDISVSSLRVAGQSATITATIKNQGNASADSFKIKYYVDNQYIGDDTLSFGLGIGSSDNESISYTAPSSGNHTIKVIADSGSEISESSESNNIREETFSWADPPKPDLIVQDISVSSPRVAGQSATITATIKNQGNASAGSFKIRYYVDNQYIGDDTLTFGLGAGSSDPETINFTAATSGNHNIKVVADSGSEISESSESNNTREDTFYWNEPPRPDLIVQDISASTPLVVGKPATITVTLKNQGNADAGSFKVSYYADNTYIGEDSLTFGLGAGSTNKESASFTPTVGGNHTVRVVVDPDNRIQESDETNNVRSETFYVTPFQVDSVVIDVAPPSVTYPGTVSRSGMMSGAASGSVTYHWEMRSPGGTWESLGLDHTVTMTDGSATIPTSQVNVVRQAGQWAYRVVVTSPNSKTSNTEYVNVEVPLPDLMVSALSSDSPLRKGATAKIDATVTNSGAGASRSANLGFYISDDSVWNSSDRLVGTVSIPSLSSDDSKNIPLSFSVPDDLTVKTYYLIAYVDYLDEEPEETNENNNLKTIAVEVSEQQAFSPTYLGALAEFANIRGILGKDADQSNLHGQYSQNIKNLAYFSAQAVLGVGIYIDLADYYSAIHPENPITSEGVDEWITVWIDGQVGAGVGLTPAGMGILQIEFDPEAPDPKRTYEFTELSASIPFLKTTGFSWSDEGFDWGNLQTSPNTEISASLINLGFNVARFEIQKSVLDALVDLAITRGAPVGTLENPAGLDGAAGRLLNSMVEFKDGWKIYPKKTVKYFTRSDDTDASHDGALNHVRGGYDTDGDGVPDNLYPIMPTFMGIPFVGIKCEVTFQNTGTDVTDFFVKIKDELPQGWLIGAKDADVGFAPILDRKIDVTDVPPVGMNGSFVTTTWVVAASAEAPETADVTFELYHDRTFPLTNTWLDAVTVTFRKGEPPGNTAPQITLITPANHLAVAQGDDFTITWTDSDPDDNAYISVAFDPDDTTEPWTGTSNHTWISVGEREDDSGASGSLVWDTSDVPEGTYTIWALIYDGNNQERYSRSPGRVSVQARPVKPTPIRPVKKNILSDLKPLFEWSPFAGGSAEDLQAGFQLRVRCDSENDAIVYDTGFISDSSGNTHQYSPGSYTGIDPVIGEARISEALQWGKHYHWHVRYCDNDGHWGEWSADSPGTYQDFYTAVPPGIDQISDQTALEGNLFTGPTPQATGTQPITWALVNRPAGMSIDSVTGVVSWPDPVLPGSPHTITIRASNVAGYDEETWQVEVLEAVIRPQIAPINDDSIPEGSLYTGPTPEVAGTQPIYWTLIEKPPGMSIDSATGVVNWPNPTPDGNPHTITIRANNSAGFDDESWQLEVLPVLVPPSIAPIADDSIPEGVAYAGPTPQVSGTKPITWTLISKPSGMFIDAATGVVTWPNPTPGGSPFTIAIRASNDAGDDIEDWILTVNAVPVPDIRVTPCPIDFGSVEVGSESRRMVTVYNDGNATLQITGISISGPDADQFGPFDQINGYPLYNIPPNGSQATELTFKPTSVGDKSATVCITSNDPDESPLCCQLTGVGQPPPTDSDGDGILDDGDKSGTAGDNPCADGQTENCDDNCPNAPNPTQNDADGDGIGDVCDDNSGPTPGDISGNGFVGLEDAVLGLKVMAGHHNLPPIHMDREMNGDGRIGMEDAIGIIQKLSGHRYQENVVFSFEDLVGKKFSIIEEDFGCRTDVEVLDQNTLRVFEGEESVDIPYELQNGLMVVPDPMGEADPSVFALESKNNQYLSVMADFGGGPFVATEGLWTGSILISDLSSLQNNVYALKDLMVAQGLGGASVTADGRIVHPAVSTVGTWWIEGDRFLFAFPDEETGCVDYKALKLENDTLYRQTDAPHRILTRWYFDPADIPAPVYTAGGTYSFSSGVLTLNTTSSDFPEYTGPELGTETWNVSFVSSDEMHWAESDGGNLQWMRIGSGTGIVGEWRFIDSQTGNVYTIVFNTNTTFSVTGKIFVEEGPNPGEPEAGSYRETVFAVTASEIGGSGQGSTKIYESGMLKEGDTASGLSNTALSLLFMSFGHPLFPALAPADVPVNYTWQVTGCTLDGVPLTVSAQVKSVSDTVTTDAGVFSGCLRIEYTYQYAYDPGSAPQFVRKVIRYWKENVGIVKAVVERTNQVDTAVLAGYNVSGPGILPSQVGNSWTYRWDRWWWWPSGNTETFTIQSVSGDIDQDDFEASSVNQWDALNFACY